MTETIDARIETHLAHYGAPPPGVSVRVRAASAPDGWRVFASSPEASISHLVAWIEALSPVEIQVDAARLVTGYFRELPAQLAFLQEPSVTEATVGADGGVCLFANGARDVVHDLLSRLRDAGRDPHVRHLAAPHAHAPLLTTGQAQAVRAAAQAGYYLIPRTITLQDLASTLGVSPASLSERLRRAEARLVMRYVRESGHEVDRTPQTMLGRGDIVQQRPPVPHHGRHPLPDPLPEGEGRR